MTDDRMDDRLEQQITAGVTDVLEQMPDAVAAVRTIAFQSIRRGRPADTAQIAARSGRTQEEIRDALELMTSVGAAKLDPEGRVVGVHGLSLVPSRHELTLDGVALYTWCAIDALGIPVALNAHASVRTPCPDCGTRLEAAVQSGRIETGGEPVVWLPTAICTNLADGLCTQIHLFCDRSHLEAWRESAGEPEGLALSMEDVAENGRRVWGYLATSEPAKRPDDDGA